MSFNFCTSGAIVRKAGVNANSGIIASHAALAEWCDHAEGYVMGATRLNFMGSGAASFSLLSTPKRMLIADATSCYAAMNVIAYDPSGYSSVEECQTLLDFLRDRVNQNIDLLKDKKVTDFIED